jgi:hypothetical protein
MPRNRRSEIPHNEKPLVRVHNSETGKLGAYIPAPLIRAAEESGLETPGIDFIRKARREGYTVYGGLTVPLVRKIGGWREIADKEEGQQLWRAVKLILAFLKRNRHVRGPKGQELDRRDIKRLEHELAAAFSLEIFNPEPDSFEHRVKVEVASYLSSHRNYLTVPKRLGIKVIEALARYPECEALRTTLIVKRDAGKFLTSPDLAELRRTSLTSSLTT